MFPTFAETDGNYSYSVYSKKLPDDTYTKYAHIIKYNGTETNVVVPDTLGGLPVWSIGSSAFGNNADLESVVIPNGVEELGGYAFSGCTSLTDVSLPDSLIIVDSAAFEKCTSLSDIVIPNSVTKLGGGVFSFCESLHNLTLPSTLTYIGADLLYKTPYYNNEANWNNGLLYFNNYLLSAKTSTEGAISIKSGTTLVAANAFSSSKITSVSFPESVKYICNGAFSYGSNLKSVALPSKLVSLGSSVFTHCEALTSIVIPPYVTTIDINTFNGCTSLSSVTLPDALTEISDYAFCDCENLTSITLPASLTKIGSNAFENCGFSSVTIPAKVTNVQQGVFAYCSNLSKITVDSNNTNLYSVDNVLYNNEGELLCYPSAKTDSNFSVPTDIEGINSYAFSGNSYLKNITLHEEMSSYLPSLIFYDAYALENINIAGNHKNYKSIDGVLFDGTALRNYPQGKTNSSYTVPEGTTEIKLYAFYGNPYLTSVVFPEGVEKISSSSVEACANLKSIDLPSTATSISSTFVYLCPELNKVNYNGTVKDWEAFRVGFDSKSRDGLYIYCTDGTVEALPPQPVYSIGDTNLDGKVNVKDATAIQKYCASLIEFSSDSLSVADVNGDSSINIKDATTIQKKVAGLI
ncbi:MAG: leucine-rich repeat protein [Ruminococcus sp.]|nr:leucine-rich repeat protein [Ruminococcus sp.]